MDMQTQKSWKPDRHDLIALLLCVASLVFWTFLLAFKYRYFGYYDWDLAVYAQVMWNLCHGSLFSSLMGMNFLANHTEFIAFLLVPFYFVFQHPFTLIVFKILSFVTGGYVLYLLARDSIPVVYAWLLTVLYLVFPANVYAMTYEFHFESLAIGPMFLTYYFLRKNKLGLFWASMVLLSLVKENMPLIVAAFGVYAVFVKKENRIAWGVVPMALGWLVFYLSVFVLAPSLRNEMYFSHQYLAAYTHLGNSLGQILQNFIVNPLEILKIVVKPDNLAFILQLSGPLLPFALGSPHALFLASPVMFQYFLSSASTQHTIFYHYGATVVPFIFLATLGSLTILKQKMGPRAYGVLFLAIITSCVIYAKPHWDKVAGEYKSFHDEYDSIRRDMVRDIGPENGVIATFSFLAELSQRQSVYSYQNVLNDNQGLVFKPFRLPGDVRFVLVDFEDVLIWLAPDYKPDEKLRRGQEFLKTGWTIKDAAGDLVLFQKSPGQPNDLIQKSDSPVADLSLSRPVIVDERFSLLAHEMGQNNFGRDRVYPFTFYWRANSDVPGDYKMTFHVKNNSGDILSRTRRVGYTLYPTRTWKKGDYFRESYWLMLPDLAPGAYNVEVAFSGSQSGRQSRLEVCPSELGDILPCAAQYRKQVDVVNLGEIIIR